MVWMRRVLSGLLIFFSIQSCTFLGDRENDVLEKYIVPDFPGEILTVDGEIIVLPLLVDDYLSNPGIGWQYRPELPTNGDLPESVYYSDRRTIAWKVLNPKEGVYDWLPLETQLREAIEQGKQFSFRVYTMVGEGYDGHMVPDWVIRKGAVILESGAPDYSNCVYQEEWGNFVNQLIRRYDGNRDIAFIDISGYGNFNEWSWQDEQTEWDQAWQENYLLDSMSPDYFKTLDGQARRRLADIFIGGENQSHRCRTSEGDISSREYSYPGFKSTQLVMPYAGILQSTQYVHSQRPDVGFRYDCLGRDGDHVMEKVGNEILKIWKVAPVIFELCVPDQVILSDAEELTRIAHASIVHDNEWNFSNNELEEMMKYVGYRYFLRKISIKQNGPALSIHMIWQNLGYAPNYPKMGQDLTLYFYLLNTNGVPVLSRSVEADISSWLPSSSSNDDVPSYEVSLELQTPYDFPKGEYFAGVSIIEERSGNPIHLAFRGRDVNKINILTGIEVSR